MKKNIYFNALFLLKNKKGTVSSKIIKTNLKEIYKVKFYYHKRRLFMLKLQRYLVIKR